MSTSDSSQLEAELVTQAKELLTQLESGHSVEAMKTISSLHLTREQFLFQEVGKLTRSLHDAIKNFHMDTTLDLGDVTELSRMEDASDRLNYVITMTERAANRTMDMVEDTMPLSNQLGERARRIKPEWERLMRRQMSPEEFRNLYKDVLAFLDSTNDDASKIESNLSNILLAQDFQDLTGQVIKKVITLVREVESNLVHLVRMAATVDQIAGFKHELAPAPSECPLGPEGPIVNPEKRTDVVSGQDEVDALLSSLGF